MYEFEAFVSYCNNNSFGLKCTHIIIDPSSLIFLDLELTHNSRKSL